MGIKDLSLFDVKLVPNYEAIARRAGIVEFYRVFSR